MFVVFWFAFALGCGDTPISRTLLGAKGDADVIYVRMREQIDGNWTFRVKIRHRDISNADYSDGWNIVATGKKVLKTDHGLPYTQILAPHLDQQPFSSTQTDIHLPRGEYQLRVRAHDIKHGWGGEEVVLDLTEDEGENYKIMRRNPAPSWAPPE